MGLFRLVWRLVPSRRVVILLALGGTLLAGGAIALVVLYFSTELRTCDEADAGQPAAPGPDLTQRLGELRRDGAFDPALVGALVEAQRADFARVEVLLVPGFLTQLLEPLEEIGIYDYLEAQHEALAPLVRRVTRVELETEGSVADNAATLAGYVARADGPVCLVSHSKGGLDSLEFLLTAEPALAAKVVCWIAYQAPFAGSPVADFVADSWVLRTTSEQLLLLFGGSKQALQDQRSDRRACYLARHDAGLRALAGRTSIVALAGAIDGEAGWSQHLTAVLPTLLWMRASGIRNDGLVPTASSALPYAPFAVLTPLDHTGAVALGTTALPYAERVLLTQALLALALEGI